VIDTIAAITENTSRAALPRGCKMPRPCQTKSRDVRGPRRTAARILDACPP
jgi:hypothetical protein